MASRRKRKPRRAPAGAEAGTMPGLDPASLDATAPSASSSRYSGRTVQTILANTLGGLMPPVDFEHRTIIADNTYCAVAPGFILNAILTDPVLAAPANYQSEIFDCDDYVQYLKTKMSLYAAARKLSAPLAVGYLFTMRHAFSFCLGENAEVFLINTQSAKHTVVGDPTLFPAFLALSADNPITCLYI